MTGRAGAKCPRHGLPLTAGPQHVQDAIQHPAQRHRGPAGRTRGFLGREQGPTLFPQWVRHRPKRRFRRGIIVAHHHGPPARLPSRARAGFGIGSKTAANIQDQSDTSVYPLAWNPVLGAKVDPENVIAAAARHKGNRRKLADWYSLPDGVPWPLDVLLCQRTNLRWDAAVRSAYANWVLATLVALSLIVIFAGIVRSLSLRGF